MAQADTMPALVTCDRDPAHHGLDRHPALAAHTERATRRPAFRRAHDDHMAHWRDADAARLEASA